MRSPRHRCLAAFVVATALARGASWEERVETLFRPPQGESMALSGDGERVAYTTRARGELAVVILHLGQGGTRRTVPVKLEREADAEESPPAPLRFLRWATNNRIVFAPAERVVPLPPVVDKDGRTTPNPDGPTIVAPIMMADADGRARGTLVDAANFQETPEEAIQSLSDLLRTPKELAAARPGPVHWRMPHLDILGFHPRDREQLVVGTRGAYSMPTRHLVDTRTATVRECPDDWPAPPGEPQVFDWFLLKVVGQRHPAARPTTDWSDTILSRVQQELAAKFPHRIVELLDWSDNRHRVLFRVTGGRDPGRVFVYQRTDDLVLEVFSRSPWLNASQLHETRWFECDARDGAHLSGYLTWPAKPAGNPPPLLIEFPAGLPGAAQPAFAPEAQVLADLGFAVARLNHRWGGGVHSGDTTSARPESDRVAVDDAQAAIAWLAARDPDRPFDRRQIAAFGRGFGGYLALRAAQLEPGEFHRAIAIDATREAAPTNPVLLLGEPAGRAAAYRKIAEFLQTRPPETAVRNAPTEEVK